MEVIEIRGSGEIVSSSFVVGHVNFAAPYAPEWLGEWMRADDVVTAQHWEREHDTLEEIFVTFVDEIEEILASEKRIPKIVRKRLQWALKDAI